MEKPVIILSCDVDERDRMRMRQEYFEAVIEAGGVPVVMPPLMLRSQIDEWLDRIDADALMLTGGCDIANHPRDARARTRTGVAAARRLRARPARSLHAARHACARNMPRTAGNQRGARRIALSRHAVADGDGICQTPAERAYGSGDPRSGVHCGVDG